jgi:hypothetical protein
VTYPTSETIRAHGPWWLYCNEPVRVREEDGRAWVLLKGGWVYVPSADGSSWGGPVRLQPGDPVTGADAPEGAPSWLGVVTRQDGGWGNFWWIYRLGERANTINGAVCRPITDGESVGLAEALTWEKWHPFGTSGVLALFADGGVIALVALRGEWSVTAPIGGGRIGRIAGGKEATQFEGMVAASRALLRWMCEGSRRVGESRVT